MFKSLLIPWDMCEAAVEEATRVLLSLTDAKPKILIVTSQDYAAMRIRGDLIVVGSQELEVRIIPVLDFPKDAWILCNDKGCVYSEGT
jgi:hypothetical protein